MKPQTRFALIQIAPKTTQKDTAFGSPVALAHVQTYYVFSLPEPTAAFRVVRLFLFSELFVLSFPLCFWRLICFRFA